MLCDRNEINIMHLLKPIVEKASKRGNFSYNYIKVFTVKMLT